MSTGKGAPRILYISESIPQQASFGGELRCLHVARALRQLGAVDVAILNTPGKTGDLEAAAHGEFPLLCKLDVEPHRNESWLQKLRWTLDPGVSYPFGCGVQGEPMRRLLDVMEQYDLLWFFSLRSPEMFPHAVWKRSVVDIDDLPTTYQRAALQTASGYKQILSARRRLFTWKRRERLLGGRFTVLAVCSEEDRRFLEELGVNAPLHVIPNGFEAPTQDPVRVPATPPRLGFIGLYDYFPNRDGINWFMRDCWPLVKRSVPGVRLRLVGRDTHGFLQENDPQIDRLGWLAETDEEIQTWSAMVVPIRVGAGTRIKIAHGFSRKCPVVSTSFGAYGYDVENGRELCLADSAEEFAHACIRMIREPQAAERMAERAWREFLENWTWDAIAPRVCAAAEDCLRRSPARE